MALSDFSDLEVWVYQYASERPLGHTPDGETFSSWYPYDPLQARGKFRGIYRLGDLVWFNHAQLRSRQCRG